MPWDKRPKVTIYTDGSCSGNPGPGGWAAIVMVNNKYKCFSGNAQHTTNCKMELTAVIEGLKQVPVPADITVRTDATYVMMDKGKWQKWQAKKNLPNGDLWMEFIKVAKTGGHHITYEHVYGHTGEEFNEKANSLACEQTEKAKEFARNHGIKYSVNQAEVNRLTELIERTMSDDYYPE